LGRLHRQGARAVSPPEGQPRHKGTISERQFLSRGRDFLAMRGREESHRGNQILSLEARVMKGASPQSREGEWSRVGTDTPWLASLIGGLPADFDYSVIRSVDDARLLILTLPSHDRGTAARGLHGHRWLVGRDAAYRGIMTAWDHDERDTIDAFGSPSQLIAALKDVAPPLVLRAPSERVFEQIS
jgi:hypothetical protein